MEEPKWFNSADEYRTISGLAREGAYREALERAQRALKFGNLGRKHAARLGSLVCWLYIGPLQQSCPAAVLYGEEALRLAHLIHDEWIRCEALAHLVGAYCHLGDLPRARAACDQIGAELERNPAAIDGGPVTEWFLRAMVARTGGDIKACLQALDTAEALISPDARALRTQVRVYRLAVTLDLGRLTEVRRLLQHSVPEPPDLKLEWDLAKAWLALEEVGPTAVAPSLAGLLHRAVTLCHAEAAVRCHALQARSAAAAGSSEAQQLALLAFSRAMAAGRMDLVFHLRRWLAGLT